MYSLSKFIFHIKFVGPNTQSCQERKVPFVGSIQLNLNFTTVDSQVRERRTITVRFSDVSVL